MQSTVHVQERRITQTERVTSEIVADERSTQLEKRVEDFAETLLNVETKIVADAERIGQLEKQVEDSFDVETKLVADAERITQKIVADAERITQLEKLVADQTRALWSVETKTVAAIAETIAEKLVDVGRKIDANSERIAKLEKRVAGVQEEIGWWQTGQRESAHEKSSSSSSWGPPVDNL